MGFFNKKRSDGVFVRSREAFSMMMPFLMPTRTESLVYYKMSLDITKTRAFIQKARSEGQNYSLFNIIAAATVRVLNDFPRSNRFIAGMRLYQRNNIELCYAVKRDMDVDAEETVVKLKFDPKGSLNEIADKMNEENSDKREGAKGSDDKLVVFFQHFPRFIMHFIVWALRRLDYNGMMPRYFLNAIPFNCSVFIANLGSLGMHAPLHHLYEFGNCPIFLTIGRIEKVTQHSPAGAPVRKMVIDVGFSIDERIVDGFYLSRVIAAFTRMVEDPSLIDAALLKVEREEA